VATPSAAGSDLPFSTDSASDVLSWIESLLTTLVGSN
jgi:hypothetical protein